MLSRRDFGGKMAAGAAVALATGVASGATRKTDTAADRVTLQASDEHAAFPIDAAGDKEIDNGANTDVAAPAPWELLRPLTVGSEVGSGWKIAGLSGAVAGSCVVTLENERGRQSRVHVFRNDGAPQGLVYTDQFDLVVMNGGIGDLATEESLAQAVAKLSHTLAGNESRGREVIASLVPHAERMRAAEGSNDRGLR